METEGITGYKLEPVIHTGKSVSEVKAYQIIPEHTFPKRIPSEQNFDIYYASEKKNMGLIIDKNIIISKKFREMVLKYKLTKGVFILYDFNTFKVAWHMNPIYYRKI